MHKFSLRCTSNEASWREVFQADEKMVFMLLWKFHFLYNHKLCFVRFFFYWNNPIYFQQLSVFSVKKLCSSSREQMVFPHKGLGRVPSLLIIMGRGNHFFNKTATFIVVKKNFFQRRPTASTTLFMLVIYYFTYSYYTKFLTNVTCWVNVAI